DGALLAGEDRSGGSPQALTLAADPAQEGRVRVAQVPPLPVGCAGGVPQAIDVGVGPLVALQGERHGPLAGLRPLDDVLLRPRSLADVVADDGGGPFGLDVAEVAAGNNVLFFVNPFHLDCGSAGGPGGRH